MYSEVGGLNGLNFYFKPRYSSVLVIDNSQLEMTVDHFNTESERLYAS